VVSAGACDCGLPEIFNFVYLVTQLTGTNIAVDSLVKLLRGQLFIAAKNRYILTGDLIIVISKHIYAARTPTDLSTIGNTRTPLC